MKRGRTIERRGQEGEEEEEETDALPENVKELQKAGDGKGLI